MNKMNIPILMATILAATQAGIALPRSMARAIKGGIDILSGGRRRERSRRMSGGKPCKKVKPKAPNDGRWHMKFHRNRRHK